MAHKFENDHFNKLRPDCSKCFGLCCTALYFSKSDGFPIDKTAGIPCINLKSDYKCCIHKFLKEKGLKGCIAYDCFGAGQKTAQVTFKGHDWHENEYKDKIFNSFLIIRQLHEMLWYLNQAVLLQTDDSIIEKIDLLINETENLTMLEPDSLLKLNIEEHRTKVNVLLKSTSELVRSKSHRKKIKTDFHRTDYFGRDLRKTDLKCADLRGACLIAANLSKNDLSFADLIGADLRDADIREANLKNSIFLTQAQINSAKGDSKTKLPEMILRPLHWVK